MTTAEFPFKIKPYAHQLACWEASHDREGYGLLFGMGAGKSKALIDTAAYLFLTGKIDGLLVLAPAGPYGDWVDEHIPTHMPHAVKFKIAQWRSSPGVRLKEELRKIFNAEPGVLHILVMNIEALLGEDAHKLANYFLSHHAALCAIDESTVIGNPKAQRTKIVLNDLRARAKYRRILTGDWAPNSPETIYSQVEFIAPGLLGSSFFAFRNRYAKIIKRKVGKPCTIEGCKDPKHPYERQRAFDDIVGWPKLDQLVEKLKPHVFIVKTEDCIDLPERTYQERKFKMGPKQAAAYKQMAEMSIAELERAWEKVENQYDMMATASQVVVRILRCHQIACGFLTTDDGIEHDFDEPNPRLNSLMELLDETSGKVIIWANYTRNILQIEKALVEKYGAGSVVTFHGATTQDERREAKVSFRAQDGARFFVANPATGKWGLNLPQATVAVYYSNCYDNEARQQSEKRNYRSGSDKNKPVTYVDMIARATVDIDIVNDLKGKVKVSELCRPSTWRNIFQKERAAQRNLIDKAA